MKNVDDGSIKLSVINTSRSSAGMRLKAIDLKNRKLLITNFSKSQQEADLSEPTNCDGLGRIRHFQRKAGPDWPTNPLPIDPACRALGQSPGTMIRAQVFQNAACNWRCWYCFVDFDLLTANEKRAEWVTADELVERYLNQPDPPSVIDLTGGQPDLTPEWIPWMMDALTARGLEDSVYLWSDDNLSNDYFWTYLDDSTRNRIASYPMYGRVCCFKGYNSESFSFNTMAEPELFDRQFELMAKLIGLGLDVYGYVTLTTPNADGVNADMHVFLDRLQAIDRLLPLRIVPLKTTPFTPVIPRLNKERSHAIHLQQTAIDRWTEEIISRFSIAERALEICNVPLGQAR